MSQLELDFYKEMLNIYEQADIQCNYRATRFKQMVAENGGVITAKKLISKNGGTEGFLRLWECNRLDLSIEALVLKDKYKELFTNEERRICKDRLKEYDFVVEE